MTQGYIPRAHARFQNLGYSSFAMVFIMQACSSAIFRKNEGIRYARHVNFVWPALSIFAKIAYSGYHQILE